MIASIELQVISKIILTESEAEQDTLCSFNSSYYSAYKPHIEFILNHKQKYGNVPDPFTFQSQFPDIDILNVQEPLTYLCRKLQENKQRILLLDMFNTLKDLGEDDVLDAWRYVNKQCEKAAQLDSSKPVDIIKQAKERSEQIIQYAKQSRIPTGFAEIDKLMYGGLSTVEELLIIIARTNTGKSWICTKMMEAAQKAGFPVLYYSPEMQSAYIGARFDTWRGHFQNSQLYQGKYTDEYIEYLEKLSKESVSAYIIEDKNMEDDRVDVPGLTKLVKKLGIKLLIIDGLSYMDDARSGKSDTDYIKYKNLCMDLFKLSKQYSCAVVVSMQANRESANCKDDKGEIFPNLYNIEGSDHPARIATQAFAVRQIFDKHVLDIRLEKTRIANNQKPILSYAWDVNTGSMQYLPGGQDDAVSNVLSPVAINGGVSSHSVASDASVLEDDSDWEDDVEF